MLHSVCQNRLRESVGEAENLRIELNKWKMRAVSEREGRIAAEKFADGLMKQVADLANKVVDLARRPPIQIPAPDATPIINAAVEGIAKAIHGNQEQVVVRQDQGERLSMDTQGLDSMAGVKPGGWVPDIEFDMSGPLPVRGGWVGAVPTGPDSSYRVTRGPFGDNPARTDGEAMFKPGAGEWGQPHEGGIVE